MAGTTTNNGWAYPTSTDLVTNGATAIQSLADGIDTSTGTGLLTWASWSPTLSGGFANGNGVWTARYAKGVNLSITLPVTAQAVSNMPFIVRYLCAGQEGVALAYVSTTTTLVVRIINVSSTYPVVTGVTATTPGTWTTSDEIEIAFTYEAA
jgi:hypothetical protein